MTLMLPSSLLPSFNRARGALCAEQTLALHCASYYTFLETHPAHANLIEYRFYNNWRNCENQLTTSCPRMLHSVSVAVVPPFTGSCSTVLRRFCIWNRQLESLVGIVNWNRGTGKYSIEYSGESEFSFFLLDVLEKEIILKYFDSKQVQKLY